MDKRKIDVILRITGAKRTEKPRAREDYYATPAWAAEELLQREKFNGRGWECACGDGAISRVLERAGYQVRSSDIRTDDNIYGEKGVDFLKEWNKVDFIITNPPFKLAEKFCIHGLECLNENGKMAIFARLQFLEGQRRYKNLFSRFPPKKIYVFAERVNCLYEGKEIESGLMAFAWFIWEKGYMGKPTIEWIFRDEK